MGKKGTKASNIFQVLKGAGAWTSKDSKGPEIKKVGWKVTSPIKVLGSSPKERNKGVDDPSNKLPEGKLPAGVQGPKTEGQTANEEMLAPPKDDKKNEKKDDGKPWVKKGGKATGKMADYALQSDERKAEYDARGWKYDDTIKGYDKDGNKIKEEKKDDDKKDDDVNVNNDDNKKDDDVKVDDETTETPEDTRTENEKKLDDAKKNLSDARDERKAARKANRDARKDKRKGRRADRKNKRADRIRSKNNPEQVNTGKGKRIDRIANKAILAKKRGDEKQSARLKKKLDRKKIKVTQLENDSPAKKKGSPAKWVQAAMALAPVAAEMLKSKNKKED